MLIFAVVIVVLAVLTFLVLTRTSNLNFDPLQERLVQLIESLNERGHTPENQHHFSYLAASYFRHYGIASDGERSTRLAHALSYMKLRLLPEEYQQTRIFLRTWLSPEVSTPDLNAPSLATEWTGPPDVFVSYASEDRDLARIIVGHLEAHSLAVWWDEGIRTGSKWEPAIRQQLESVAAVVVLWSPISSVSEWVQTEAMIAIEGSKLTPAFIRKCRLPDQFTSFQTVDLSDWTGDPRATEWLKLLSAVEELRQRRA